MSVTVHRAAVVFSPRFAVLVNPPDPAVAAQLRAAGGGARALEWVLDGMTADDPTQGRQTYAGLLETLRQAGLSDATAQELAQAALDRGEVDAGHGGGVVLPDSVREKAHEEALSLASAVRGGRTRVADMVAGTTPPLRTLYEGAYGDAMRDAHLAGVDLLANFPVATLSFGYTRGDMSPGVARLVPFRERGHVREHVPGIGEQRERVRQISAHRLGHEDHGGDDERDAEAPYGASGAVRVTGMTMTSVRMAGVTVTSV